MVLLCSCSDSENSVSVTVCLLVLLAFSVLCYSVCFVQEYMPLPQADDLAVSDTSSADTAAPKLQFSYVECLMYTFYQVARHCPQFLTAEQNANRLKDFRMRLSMI